MTGPEQILHQIKLRLGQTVPASSPEVEVQVSHGLKTTVERGVGMD